MIFEALNYIREEVAFELGLPPNDVVLEKLQVLKNDKNADGLYISLLNVEQEGVLRNTPHYTQNNNQIRYKEPPVYLNLYIFFAFGFTQYTTSLQRMAEAIEFFQSKTWFSAENERAANPFPSGLHKIMLELFTLNFEQMNDIWGVLGGDHFPSVMYKLRLIKIQKDVDVSGPEITTISVNTAVNRP